MVDSQSADSNPLSPHCVRCGRDQLLGRLQAAAAANDRAALEALVQSYGRELISAVGAEVDRIEGEIQKLNPGACVCMRKTVT